MPYASYNEKRNWLSVTSDISQALRRHLWADGFYVVVADVRPAEGMFPAREKLQIERSPKPDDVRRSLGRFAAQHGGCRHCGHIGFAGVDCPECLAPTDRVDAEASFRARAARGDVKRGLVLLDDVDEAFRRQNRAGERPK